MNKSVKKIITSIIISAVTLAVGFGITMVSFNLFDSLTANQMKVLFTIDMLCLIGVGAVFFFLSESKEAKKRKERELQKRRRQRAEQFEENMMQINSIISNSNYAA
ncbi:MAG: hypothetical protein PUE08_06895 [Eubacteriales bacterium]|nr:hypothetical protein [Eubacteriales bacterium]